MLRTALLAFALSPAVAAAADGAATKAAAPDLSALIECRLGHADFMAYMPVLQDPLKAVALGWRPLPQSNPFMVEYRLNAPVTVFGRSSDHIAFAGEGVVAVLDLPDPRVLARELQLETAIDTPQKVLAGKEARATVLDVLAMAKGFNEFADKGRIIVLRRENGVTKQYAFQYMRLLQDNSESGRDNFFVQPGDIVLVR